VGGRLSVDAHRAANAVMRQVQLIGLRSGGWFIQIKSTSLMEGPTPLAGGVRLTGPPRRSAAGSIASAGQQSHEPRNPRRLDLSSRQPAKRRQQGALSRLATLDIGELRQQLRGPGFRASARGERVSWPSGILELKPAELALRLRAEAAQCDSHQQLAAEVSGGLRFVKVGCKQGSLRSHFIARRLTKGMITQNGTGIRRMSDESGDASRHRLAEACG
jgi:hypothetical protein